MGKNKESGRSKTRPSSSSLAASLLPPGAQTVGFGGYFGGSRVESASTEEEPSTSPSPGGDGEIVLHLKRLGKKDPITKLKALTALRTLFMEKNGEEIVHMIPQWAFEYKRLLNDYNRDVRRATHQTMASLVISVGRLLAPHLKSLMGPWWFSQFDRVSEISLAARKSFEAAFPAQEKRMDALIHYSKEVFTYLEENLRLTPQAMSDKGIPMDELEDMHYNVISSSLLALATLVDMLMAMKTQSKISKDAMPELNVSSRATQAAGSCAENILHSHNYFLEFLKSKNSGVRSSTYSALASFLKHAPEAFKEENMKMFCGPILNSLQEKDSSCHSSMWNMILLFSRRFPECWSQSNTQRNALTRLWQFLRNESYGSQQISCPILLPLLNSLPTEVVVEEHFILNFFQNLWLGRNPYRSQPPNVQAFFNALKECLLWALYKASRSSCLPDEHIGNFQARLLDEVLVKLLWSDYLPLVTSVDSSDSRKGENCSTRAKSTETACSSYPITYIHNLGKCIVEILLEIYLKDSSTLSAFCSTFLNDCLEVFQKGQNLSRFSELVERITNFFSLLGEVTAEKTRKWLLDYLARPLVVKSLPLIKSLDCPEAVRFLIVIVDIFGPRIVILYGSSSYKGQDYGENTEEFWKESSAKCFLQAFEDEFIPWCMSAHSKSSSSKLDLLISLLDKELFSAQWDSIIKHSTKILLYGGVEVSESDAELVSTLAMLMDKVRGKIKEKKIPDRLNGQEGCLLEDWRHALLDSAAVAVACSATCANKSHARFLHSVIGGSSEGDQLSLLSGEALVQIFEKILDNFVAVLVQSSHNWAKIASSLLLSTACQNLDKKKQLSGYQVASMAQFSLDVLVGSIFSLLKLNKDLKLLPYLLAATFLMEWDESLTMAVLADGVSQHNMIQSALLDESLVVEKAVDARLSPGGRVGAYAFRSKIGPHFWKSLDSSTLMILRNILIETIRTAVFDVDVLFLKKIPILCCKWVIDVLEVICWNHNEEQMALDQLLSENECWPMWVSPCFGSGTRSAAIVSERECSQAGHEQQHHQFIAFIGELITGLGVNKVLGDLFYENTSSCSSEDVDLAPSSAYSRPWLAAEILCSWNWMGGSAAESLLPLFIDYNDNPICTKKSFWRYVVSVLLDGAILYGPCSQLTFFNLWTPSDDEVENIQDPYLRALVSLLMTLIAKYSTWKSSDAVWVFEHIVNKLYIGTNINKSCLKILPFVLNIISQPLIERNGKSEKSSESIPFNLSLEDSIRGHVVNWLQTAISLPPLAVDKTENQDLVDWIQVIISCYPLNTSGAVGYCSVTRPGEVSALEISLLVKLFRLQRCGQSVPASSQIMLAKLTAVSVGYCWQEFDDDDWDYLLTQLRRWMGSSVLMMEEITEKVEDAVVNSTVNQEDIIEKLEFAVQAFDPVPLNISNIALVVLSLFSEHSGGRQMEEDGVLPSTVEKWNNCKDMIFEDVLRLFFATGAAEAIANSLSEEASYVVASSRHGHCDFWRLVCTCVIDSPQHIRKSAVQSMDLWGLSVGPVSSLYGLLFSSTPISSLQLAAYNILSTEPVCAISLCDGKTSALQDQDPLAECSAETSEETIELRNEISLLIEKPFPEILEIDMVAEHRVNFFLGWSLLLSYLRYLPSSSSARERLTQHIQDSVSSTILDCIFQHIQLESGSFSNMKKKGADLPIEVSKAAHSAMLAITTGSLSSAVQSLWPVGTEQMAALAGAIYGSMIHLLPAYVRNWFTNLRDRSLTSAIESFTKTWCSPPLIADEFSQMKEACLVADYFSVSVNKTAYEIIATYKKEETGMDLVIRLPGCYPLRPVDVECTRSLGISEVKQRKWLLSMTAFIRNQNGAIAEAVRIWKSNFDKEFQGVEECPICYSIIHTANHSLPRLACKTCKHKFHSACLFKWFSTSNKSTCPLCQMPF